MNEEKGFTTNGLLAVIAALSSIALTGLMIYALVHFVVKYW